MQFENLFQFYRKNILDSKAQLPDLLFPKHAHFLVPHNHLMLTCDCEDCDDSIAEIKCPYSIAHTKPSAANLFSFSFSVCLVVSVKFSVCSVGSVKFSVRSVVSLKFSVSLVVKFGKFSVDLERIEKME